MISSRRPIACVALVAAAVLGASAALASGQNIPPVTTCGIPYTFTFAHHTPVSSGSCAGLLPLRPPRVVLRRGQTFYVRIEHEQNGRLDFPVPTPTNGAVKRLRTSGATVAYLAASRGSALLVARHTHFCSGIDPRIGSCSALRVVVAGG